MDPDEWKLEIEDVLKLDPQGFIRKAREITLQWSRENLRECVRCGAIVYPPRHTDEECALTVVGDVLDT